MHQTLHFGSRPLGLVGFSRCTTISYVLEAAARGSVEQLVLDARTPHDLFQAEALLRALLDDPRRSKALIDPRRIVAVVQNGAVSAAFALGRFGIAEVFEESALSSLPQRIAQLVALIEQPPLRTVPLDAPWRPTQVSVRAEAQLPTVTAGFQHAKPTLQLLHHYEQVLRKNAEQSTVFADTATLLAVLVKEGLTFQTDLAAKAGATNAGQFVGAFEFYRQLRKTRYRHLRDDPTGAIAMEVFIVLDEILHETLHLLFLANEYRAQRYAQHTLLAEELSVTWWQAVVHTYAFPKWFQEHHLLEINDDFMLKESNQGPRGFWKRGAIFSSYLDYPWVPYVLRQLPQRESYIGTRPDIEHVLALFRQRPDAQFLFAEGEERLRINVPFDAFPTVPSTLSLPSM